MVTPPNGTERQGPWPGGEAETFSGLFNHTQVILLDGTDGKLDGVVSVARRDGGGLLTISVASTRVPTIFSRTFVFFSMIWKYLGNGAGCDVCILNTPDPQRQKKVGLSWDQISCRGG